MASIKFDSTEILNTTYVPRYVKHESVARRMINSLPLAREDGEILISEKYGTKRIFIRGVIIGISQADVESKIDAFKELFSRAEKNLDIDWNSGTRRYVASCPNHNFDRDHFNITFVPWTAEFVVLSGEGKDTSETTALNENALVTTTPASDSFSMLGSKPAKPYIKIQGNNFPATGKGLEYKNADSGERIIITKNVAWPNTAYIEIDCDAKTVQHNLQAIVQQDKFYGVFPKFIIGTNNVQIKIGGIENQRSYDDGWVGYAGYNINTVNTYVAQSFSIPYADDTFQGLILALAKTGTPGNLEVEIQTDNGDEPSGVLAHANAHFSFVHTEIGAIALITKYMAALWELEANTKYWIVIYPNIAGPIGAGNIYAVGYAAQDYVNTDLYPRGNVSISVDAGVTWTPDLDNDVAFAVLYGGVPAASNAKHTVKYTKKYL